MSYFIFDLKLEGDILFSYLQQLSSTLEQGGESPLKWEWGMGASGTFFESPLNSVNNEVPVFKFRFTAPDKKSFFKNTKLFWNWELQISVCQWTN